MPESGTGFFKENCQRCGRELRSEAQFCPSCGHAVGTLVSDGPAPPKTSDRRSFELHWREIKLIGLLFGLLLASSFVLGIASRFGKSSWAEIIVVAADAATVFIFATVCRRRIMPLLRLPEITRRSVLEMIVMGTGFFVAMGIYFAVLQGLGVSMIRISDHYGEAGYDLFVVFALVSLMPAVVEELAFRGVIQSTLEGIFNAREAAIVQAAMFSVLHLSPIVFPSHFIMGLCFGYARSRWQSLFPSMVLHASWNAFVVYREVYWA
jgi:membrane protease YdiL (CAAX protease family)